MTPKVVMSGIRPTGTPVYWTLTISNTGTAPLTVTSVSSSHGDMTIASPAFPQTIDPASDLEVLIEFVPTSQGTLTTWISILTCIIISPAKNCFLPTI